MPGTGAGGSTGCGLPKGSLRYVRGSAGPPPCSPRPRPSPWPTCQRARPPAPLGCARSRLRALRQARVGGQEGRRVDSDSRGRCGRFRAAPCAPPARRACPSAGTRGAGGRALAGGGPAGPRASPGTRPCHSHDAQPPGTASGARRSRPWVGGGRDDLRGGRPAPRRAGPALPSRAPTAPGPGGPPRDSAVATDACPREGGARVSALSCAPGPAPPGTRGAGRAAGLASPCRPRRAGTGSGRWLGLASTTGEGHGPREEPPALGWRFLRPAFLESQRAQVGPR